MMVGTVSYMPPEQALGGEVTPRSDLYSLGAMLYEMIAGRPPFVGDESVAIIGQHLNTPPVAPAWHRPDCPAGLETLILRLLEKDPGKRPASASEVGEALERVAEHLSSRPPSPRGKEETSLSLAQRAAEGAGLRAGAAPVTTEGQGEGETRAAANAQAAPDNPLYRRVFVGREPELRQLQTAFDAVLSGKGALAMVVGEPGIGKTALCEQLATYASRLAEARTLLARELREPTAASREDVELPTVQLVVLLEAAVLLGDREASRWLVRQLAPAAASATCSTALTFAARHLGAASALLGEREQAMRYYEQALEVCGRLRFRPEIALTHLGIAELLLGEPEHLTPGPFPAREGEQKRGQGEGQPEPSRGARASSAGAGGSPAPPEAAAGLGMDARAEAMQHLDFAIAELRAMKMQPALERALRHKEVLKA